MCLQCHSTCDRMELSRLSLPVIFRPYSSPPVYKLKIRWMCPLSSLANDLEMNLVWHLNVTGAVHRSWWQFSPLCAGVRGGRVRWAEPPEQRGVLRLLLQPLDRGGSPEGGRELPCCHQLCGQTLCHRGWPWWQHLFWQGQLALLGCIFYPQQAALLSQGRVAKLGRGCCVRSLRAESYQGICLNWICWMECGIFVIEKIHSREC